VTRLVRRPAPVGEDEAVWDPRTGVLDRAAIEGHDAVVHLAGESIASGRWTRRKKESIRRSRVEGTRLLSETLARLERPPEVLVAASAVGYYGDRGSKALTEGSAPGDGFLAEVCRQWEAAAEPPSDHVVGPREDATPGHAREETTQPMVPIRVVNLRIGVVLGAQGGVLARMLPPFRFGLGGPVGSGDQYLSWIALGDLLNVIHHAIATRALSGPVNAVAPNPVTNREFARTLGRVLKRPAFFRVPAFILRLLLGEMADELLLSSARVHPAKLLASDFAFRCPHLEGALRKALQREEFKRHAANE